MVFSVFFLADLTSRCSISSISPKSAVAWWLWCIWCWTKTDWQPQQHMLRYLS